MLALTILDLLKLFLPVLAILLAGPVGRYWRRVGAAQPHLEGDRIVLRMPRPHVVIVHCVAFTMVGFGLYLALLFRDVTAPSELPVLLLVVVYCCAFVLFVGAGFAWVSLRVRLERNAAGLRGRTYLCGYRTMAWSAIARLGYSQRFKSLRIRDAHGVQFVAYPWMPGFPVLLEQLRRHVPEEITEPAAHMAEVDPLK